MDILFIDSDHTYDGVKRDFELYSTLIKDDGIIGLHDTMDSQVTAGKTTMFVIFGTRLKINTREVKNLFMMEDVPE